MSLASSSRARSTAAFAWRSWISRGPASRRAIVALPPVSRSPSRAVISTTLPSTSAPTVVATDGSTAATKLTCSVTGRSTIVASFTGMARGFGGPCASAKRGANVAISRRLRANRTAPRPYHTRPGGRGGPSDERQQSSVESGYSPVQKGARTAPLDAADIRRYHDLPYGREAPMARGSPAGHASRMVRPERGRASRLWQLSTPAHRREVRPDASELYELGEGLGPRSGRAL